MQNNFKLSTGGQLCEKFVASFVNIHFHQNRKSSEIYATAMQLIGEKVWKRKKEKENANPN